MSMNEFARQMLPGILVALGLALLAIFFSGYLNFLGSATMAIVLGAILGNAGIETLRIDQGLKFSEKYILESAIILIGFGLNVRIFPALGWISWMFVGLSVVLVILVASAVSRWFGISSTLGTLLGAGSAICGSAAIGAVSPLLESREEETGLSIGIINLLGTLGLVVLPLLAGALALDVEDSGLLIGGVLQSMGHVVGAGFSISDDVGKAATIVKMGRILFLIPVMLVIYFWGRKENNGIVGKVKFPLFIPLFAFAMILAQMPFFPSEWIHSLSSFGEFLLVVAMIAIGFRIKLRSLFRLAGPAVAVGSIVFAFQIILYLFFVNYCPC